MKNSYALDEESQGLAENYEKSVEKMKTLFTELAGKKREGQICSILDSTLCIFYTPQDEDDLDRELFIDMFEHLPLYRWLVEKGVNRDHIKSIGSILAGYIYGDDRGNALNLVCTNKLTNEITAVYFIPSNASNEVVLHEHLHGVSSRLIFNQDDRGRPYKRSKNFIVELLSSETPPRYTLKTGLGIGQDPLDGLLNEAFTDYLAIKTGERMKELKMENIADGEYSPSVYTILLPILSDFFENHMAELKDSFFGEENKLFSLYGEDNYLKLNASIEMLYRFASFTKISNIGEAVEKCIKIRKENPHFSKDELVCRLENRSELETYNFCYSIVDQIYEAIDSIENHLHLGAPEK